VATDAHRSLQDQKSPMFRKAEMADEVILLRAFGRRTFPHNLGRELPIEDKRNKCRLFPLAAGQQPIRLRTRAR
jgi:hypothetical protein